MADRYSAFSFVDRITGLEPGVCVRGQFHVPTHLPRFPAALVAEAIGQLAAWASMDQLDYRLRPVAGIAAAAHFLGEVVPGDTLELSVEIHNCADEDVSYSGSATVAGSPIVRLEHCLGPMLPMAEFDEPTDVRERFQLLMAEGAPVDRLPGLPEFSPDETAHEAGGKLHAILRVPDTGAFFGDHFPRRPVFPATLLVNEQVRLLGRLCDESTAWGDVDTPPRVLRVLDMKQRAFVPPDSEVELRVKLNDPDENGLASARISAHLDDKRIAFAKAEVGIPEEYHDS